MDKLSNVLCIVGLLICGLVLQGCASERPARMRDGEMRNYAEDSVDDLRVGERVRVDANQIYH